MRAASRHEWGQQQDIQNSRTASRNENSSRAASRNEEMQPPPPPLPQSAIEPPSARQLDEAFERQGGRTSDYDTNLKKRLAAQELEARRESLARRPQVPPIPHPADLSNATVVTRPPLGTRSQTIPSDSPTLSRHSSAIFSDSPASQRISPQKKEFSTSGGHRAGAASMGQYGLPATPRAMRHPNHSASNQIETMPALPELPSIQHLHQAIFHTGHPIHDIPRSMSAPMPEYSLTPVVDLPQHPAFHKGLRTGNPSKRSEISSSSSQNSARPQYRRRPSTDFTATMAAATAPVPFYLDESLQATESTVQIVTIDQQPPLLPELQHLLPVPPPQAPPPPPPPPPFSSDGAHSSKSSSSLGVINIAIDDPSSTSSPSSSNQNTDHHVIDVPLASPPPNERPNPVTTGTMISRSNSTSGKRGRSEAAMGFKNSVKAVTDRLRSTSRGRANRSAQGGEMKAPSPYESVPVNYF